MKLHIPVYIPFGDNEKADLIVDVNNKLYKIQVKTSINAKDGKMVFDLTSSTTHRKNGNIHKYTRNEIDYFFCYNIERNKCFLVEVPDEPVTIITIRYEPSKNNQTKNIHFEDDYLLENKVKQLICE